MHVAIIMDGNGRWATKRGMPRVFGHKKGMEKVIEAVEWADDRGVDILTLYAFSTENWARPKQEVDFLMNLLVEYIDRELRNLHEKNAKIRILGSPNGLPSICVKKLDEAVELTKNNTGLEVNFAINYSALSEVERAVKNIVTNGYDEDEIDIDLIKNNLYTAGQEDPDMIIRTAGEKRLSNFLLLQAAYSEFVFRDICWPDITWEELDSCVDEFNGRKRKYGGLK